MKTQRAAFWSLAVALVFGIVFDWPIFLKVITIALSGIVLYGVAVKLISAYRKKA